MALFKIFKGNNKASLDNKEKVDGYAYYNTDNGLFYIDAYYKPTSEQNDNPNIVVDEDSPNNGLLLDRRPLNAHSAFYDEKGNSLSSYIKTIQIEENLNPQRLTLTKGDSSSTYLNIPTGVKGDTESSYRTGQVNITKANIGLGNVTNYDSSKAIKQITRDGTTYTYTCVDGTTGTFTQQDLADLNGIGNITASGTAPLTLSASKSGTAVTISGSIAEASTTTAGSMSAADKLKLDNINLNNYMVKDVDYVTAGKNSLITLGTAATAEGSDTSPTGDYSHAEGNSTDADGDYSHAEGFMASASGSASHAEGDGTLAQGESSHAEGIASFASGTASHAEGYSTEANGNYSHSEGFLTKANGNYSHADGRYTEAKHQSQHVFGEYNIVDPSSATFQYRGTYVEIVGNGTSATTRSNARTLDWNGNETLAGKLTIGLGPTENMDVATKQYVDNSILDSFAANDAMIFKGVISSNNQLPEEHQQGWTYRVDTAGSYANKTCEIGDIIICVTSGTAINNDHWAVIQNNIDGAIYRNNNTFTDANIIIADGTNGKVKSSGKTITETAPSSNSTNTTIPSSSAVWSAISNASGYDKIGTVTSVRVQATSPIQSSVNTEQTNNLNTTISLADAYGDTKNPYGTKNANYILAGPSSGNSAAPSFRELVAADIPNLDWAKITSGNDDLKAIENLTGTSGLLKKTAANTWTLDTNSYVTSSGVTSITIKAGDGISITDGDTAITTSGTRTIVHTTPTNATAGELGSTATRYYIKTITTDKFGHVTGYTTGNETITNTDTKQNITLATTSKAYITGVTTTPTSTTVAMTGIADTDVYLTTTAGQMNAKSYQVDECAVMQYDRVLQAIEFAFI